MKTNDITLNVSIDDLKNTIEIMKSGNTKYLPILDNLFLIENISTCLRIKNTINWFNHKTSQFKFSYNDETIKNLITIKYTYEDDSVYAFLLNSDFINETQLNTINNKVLSISRQMKTNSIKETIDNINDMLYNEALIIITNGINKDDINNVKDNFENTFVKWKNNKNEINNNGNELINNLYKLLIEYKLNEK